MATYVIGYIHIHLTEYFLHVQDAGFDLSTKISRDLQPSG